MSIEVRLEFDDATEGVGFDQFRDCQVVCIPATVCFDGVSVSEKTLSPKDSYSDKLKEGGLASPPTGRVLQLLHV